LNSKVNLSNPMKQLLPFFCLLVSSLVAVDKPNVILINADDLGYGDLSCYGAYQGENPQYRPPGKRGTSLY
tara:strand:+ start:575 stop:787 length:213 start_codon:yes stop_codon:yes gene_type:complete